MNKWQVLGLRKSLTVCDAAELISQGIGDVSQLEALIIEAIELLELPATVTRLVFRDYWNGDYYGGIDRMKTTLLRADLDCWMTANDLSFSTRSISPNIQPKADGQKYLLKNRTMHLDAEIDEARKLALDASNVESVWAELIKLSENKTGLLIGFSSDGVQYRGKKYQDSGEPDIFTKKNLRDRSTSKRAKTG